MGSSSSSAATTRNPNYAANGNNVQDDVNQIVSKNGSAVQGVQDQINVASGDLSNVCALLQDTEKEIGDQSSKVSAARDKAQGLQQQMAALQADPKGNADAIKALQPQLDAANSDLAAQQQKLDQLTATAQGLNDQITSLKGKLESLRQNTLPAAQAKDKASTDANVRAQADQQAQKANDAITAAETQADTAQQNARSFLTENNTPGFSAAANDLTNSQFYQTGRNAASPLDIPYVEESLAAAGIQSATSPAAMAQQAATAGTASTGI